VDRRYLAIMLLELYDTMCSNRENLPTETAGKRLWD